MNNENFKQTIIVISLLASIGLMYWGAMTPPPGEISSSILIMCGEIMIFILTILGVSDIAVKFLSDINAKLGEYKEIHNNVKNDNKA